MKVYLHSAIGKSAQVLVGLEVDDASFFDDSKPCRDRDSAIFSYILLLYD